MTVNDPDARATFEGKVRTLERLRIQAVDYWDIHIFGPEPARWDYGDWHHAVMGVQLVTDAGPVTVTWTSAFYPYGVEVSEFGAARIAERFGPQKVFAGRFEDASFPVVSVGVGGHALSTRWVGPGSRSNTPILPRLPRKGGTPFLLRPWAGRARHRPRSPTFPLRLARQ